MVPYQKSYVFNLYTIVHTPCTVSGGAYSCTVCVRLGGGDAYCGSRREHSSCPNHRPGGTSWRRVARRRALRADAGALVMNAAGEGPGYLTPQGESGVIPVPPPGVVGKTR